MKRNKIVKVSLSDKEYEKLVVAASETGVSPSEFLRDVVKSLSAIHPGAPLSGERRDSRG
jgi:hypothetical protein